MGILSLVNGVHEKRYFYRQADRKREGGRGQPWPQTNVKILTHASTEIWFLMLHLTVRGLKNGSFMPFVAFYGPAISLSDYRVS